MEVFVQRENQREAVRDLDADDVLATDRALEHRGGADVELKVFGLQRAAPLRPLSDLPGLKPEAPSR